MFAIVRTGGKQYRVSPKSVLKVEKIEAPEGATVVLDEVLALGTDGELTLGRPLIAGASVSALVLGQEKARKILILKKRRRKNSRRRQGHRQLLTVLRVGEIRKDASDGA
ncbi:MAG: 50S ribosomal protein L21 [Acetobacteraceae bacterium]